MITEQLFYWLISGLCMVIAFLLVWILKSIITDLKETKIELREDIIVIRSKQDSQRIDHERLSADVKELVAVVRSNEVRDNRRLDIMEKIINDRKK